MKIGFDAKRAVSNFTGLGNYSRFVISNLIKFNPSNTYVLFTQKLPKEQIKNIPHESIKYTIKTTRKPLWRSWGIIDSIKKDSIDIYHGLSNELPFGIKRTTVKSVVTIHDLIFIKYPKFYPIIDRIIYNIKARYACKAADKIIAVSECTKRDIIEHYNIPSSKIEVVYQGCATVFKEKVSNEQKIKIRNRYNLPDEFLLSVGSIEERKNILLIVKALKLIPDIHFVAIGKKRKYAQEVIKYAEEHNLSDRLHIISDVPFEDLPVIMQSSTIFIYPSLYEGFGIPIIEALYSGIPVIGATGSCLEEAGGPHSIYVNPHSEEELAFEINQLLKDEDKRNTMIEKGLEYVQRFSDETCTKDMIEVYDKLLS